MKNIKAFKNIATFIRQNYQLIGFFLVLFAIFWTNTFHTNFSDEFDNIVGGWYINKGILPYIGFFTHHHLGAYYIASLITLFTKQSFVGFRMVWAAILYISSVLSFIYISRKVIKKYFNFYLMFLFLIGISATYHWGHMMLSETIVGYALTPIYGLILYKTLDNQEFSITDFIWISLATFISIMTSLTFSFAIGALLSGLFLSICKRKINQHGLLGAIRKEKKFLFTVVLIFIIPYILFAGYLLMTKSTSEYIFQAIKYNREYYIYNFPQVAGQVSKHPVRYAISIFYNVSDQFRMLLLQTRDFNFSYPVNTTLALGNIILVIYLFTKKRYSLGTGVYAFMVFLNARGEPLNSGETDFHSTVYIMASLFNISLMLYLLFQEINQKNSPSIRLIYQSLFLLLAIYSIFSSTFFIHNFSQKAHSRFMGQAPGIYDEPVVAPIINQIVSDEEYFWIGPFEFQELLYINGKLPSKYHWFLPAHAKSDRIKTNMIADLARHRPKLIVFKDYFQTFGTSPEDYNYFMTDFLKENYVRFKDLDKNYEKYEVLRKDLHNFDIWTDFYYDREREDEIIDLLIDKQIIELKQD